MCGVTINISPDRRGRLPGGLGDWDEKRSHLVLMIYREDRKWIISFEPRECGDRPGCPVLPSTLVVVMAPAELS